MMGPKLMLFFVLLPAAAGDCAGEQCSQDGTDHAEFMQHSAIAKHVPTSTMMQKTSTIKDRCLFVV